MAGSVAALFFLPAAAILAAGGQPSAAQPAPAAAPAGFEFIDTGFENASPLWYDIDSGGAILVYLLYDRERSSPNRAAGHIHFQIHAKPGSDLTLEFKNLDNVWNSQPASIARELKTAVISENGRDWKPVPLDTLPGDRIRMKIRMPGPRLYVARVEPYRLSDLDRMIRSIRDHPLVRIETIGQTVAKRDLEIIRIGSPRAPYRVFLRARAHPWEAGGNWVVEGLVRRLLDGDEETAKFLRTYSVYIMPMANKDGVAAGRTRFNLQGKDLNRNWDQPADGKLAPENEALEKWLEKRISDGQRPHLALELHNDGSGRLHLSRVPIPTLAEHLRRMQLLETLLRKHTWFTEGSTNAEFRNPATLGEGWLLRYGIDAAVHEFHCNWIEGVKDYPSARHWQTYGSKLGAVFYDYFEAIKPQ